MIISCTEYFGIVHTAVAAAAVGVDRPVEWESSRCGYAVQRRLRQDLVEGDARELRCAYRSHQIVESVQPWQGGRISDGVLGDFLTRPSHGAYLNIDSISLPGLEPRRPRRPHQRSRSHSAPRKWTPPPLQMTRGPR